MVLQAAYPVTKLARMTGISRWQLYRLLRKKRVRTIKGMGTVELVSLIAFRDAFPDLYASMLERLRLAPNTPIKCNVCGTSVVD